MALTLVEDKTAKVAGITLHGRGSSRQTAVYLPRRTLLGETSLDVLVWLHGYYVDRMEDILKEHASGTADANLDPRLKQQVLASGKDLVVVAPFLGHVPFKPSADEWAKAKTQTEKDALTKRSLAHDSGASGYAGARDSLGSGTAAFDYLNDVLAAIGAFHAKSKTPPGDGGGTTARDTPAAAPKLGRLFIGCHSGGGEGMLKMPNGLGSHLDKLKECWGYDCIYSGNYEAKIRGHPKVTFFLYSSTTFNHAYDLYVKKYGNHFTGAAPSAALANLRLAIAPTSRWMGVEDDSRAFVGTSTILKHKDNAMSYESFRRGVDLSVETPKSWMKFRRENAAHLRPHFETPATLLRPRIEQSW